MRVANLFTEFFDGCPVIQVPSRLCPIQLKYVPLTSAEVAASQKRLDAGPYVRLLQHIDFNNPANDRGALLVFLPELTEIYVDAYLTSWLLKPHSLSLLLNH